MTEYDSNGIYQGTVVSQTLTETKAGVPQLRLGVQLTHKLRTKLASDGVDALPEDLASLKTMYFNFPADNKDQLERTFRDLRSIGLNSVNIELLDPNHPKAIKFEGKVVNLKPRYSTDMNGNQRDWWNLVTPLSKAPAISSEALSRFKNMNAPALNEAFANSAKPKNANKDEKIPF